MLYEVITQNAERCIRTRTGESVQNVWIEDQSSFVHYLTINPIYPVITSYSIHYTKLYDVVLEQEGNVLYFGARTNYDYTSKWQYYAVYDEYGYAYTEGANWVDSDKTWFSKPLLQEDKAKAAEFTTVAAGFAGNRNNFV